MFVIKYRKIWFAISAVLIGLSFFAMFTYGFRESIDFKGGTLTGIQYENGAPSLSEVNDKVSSLELGGFSVQPVGESGYTIRTRELSDEERTKLVEVLTIEGKTPSVNRQTTIGPVAGTELRSKAQKAVAVVVLMIVLFVTFAFRKVSRPVSSWKYGLATVIALSHDVIVPTGVFAYLGHYYGTEIDLLFITGLLAILGYSVHDTIVVFDRVRENLHTGAKNEPFEETVGRSVSQTFGRSINTSLTIFITLLALYLVGSAATKEFSLLLIIGVVIGTYSSIFVASPLLVTFYKWGKNKGK
jgi:preprotein translocase subunit SecF